MTERRLWSWLAVVLGGLYFLLPLVGMVDFSMRMQRDGYSFEAYRVVLADPQFQQTFGYSVVLALLTIVLGILIVVPTAYFVRLRFPGLRPIVEFLTLLPLVIPPIVIVFGYIRIYNTSSVLPLTGSWWGTNLLLLFGYATLSLPYMYRSVDTGLRTIDIGSLTEAAQSLGPAGRAFSPSSSCRTSSSQYCRGVPDLRDRHRRICLCRPAQRRLLRSLHGLDGRQPSL